MFKSYRDGSKENWGVNDKKTLTLEQIQTGAILRIADATEVMAKRHIELITQRDMYERWYNQEVASHKITKKSLNSTKGHLTRAKNRIKELEAMLAEKDTPTETQQ